LDIFSSLLSYTAALCTKVWGEPRISSAFLCHDPAAALGWLATHTTDYLPAPPLRRRLRLLPTRPGKLPWPRSLKSTHRGDGSPCRCQLRRDITLTGLLGRGQVPPVSDEPGNAASVGDSPSLRDQWLPAAQQQATTLSSRARHGLFSRTGGWRRGSPESTAAVAHVQRADVTLAMEGVTADANELAYGGITGTVASVAAYVPQRRARVRSGAVHSHVITWGALHLSGVLRGRHGLRGHHSHGGAGREAYGPPGGTSYSAARQLWGVLSNL
jgi:hypothetical protein